MQAQTSEQAIVAITATVRNNRHILSDGETEQLLAAGRQIEVLERRLAAQREAAAAASALLQKQPWETEISTLISALNILAQDIRSHDGIANSAIAEGAARLGRLHDALQAIVYAITGSRTPDEACRVEWVGLRSILSALHVPNHAIDAAVSAIVWSVRPKASGL
jgi:hypothetical protein